MASLKEYLQLAESNPSEDFHLKSWLEFQFVEVFMDKSRKQLWDGLLKEIEAIDVDRNPLIEAVYNLGLWRRDDDYKKGGLSGEKFIESARFSKEKKWYWILSYSFQEAIFVFDRLRDKTYLRRISKEIADCLRSIEKEARDHTLMELLRLFCKVIYFSDQKDSEDMSTVSKELAHRTKEGDYFNFQQNFIDLAIEIAEHLKKKNEVERLHKEHLQSILDEAEFKGKSLLVKKMILQKALKYCVDKVGDTTKIKNLKKQIKELDISSELKEIRLSKEQQKELEEAYKKHIEHIEKLIEDYTNRILQLAVDQVIPIIMSDKGLEEINVQREKKLVEELARKSPLRYFVSRSLEMGDKIIQQHDDELMKRNDLNMQLILNIREKFWIWTKIFDELTKKWKLSEAVVCSFLVNCKAVTNADFEIIMEGVIKHFEKDFISSISILTPKIESTLLSLLDKKGADVTSYKENLISERALGGLLGIKDAEELFREDFTYLMRVFLVEFTGMNFRNRLTHGKTTLTEFNETVSTAILFILLKICSKSYEE